ncbi:MAG: hypothetical protein H7832_01040 [Magnetococcus sp. DMHC-6]
MPQISERLLALETRLDDLDQQMQSIRETLDAIPPSIEEGKRSTMANLQKYEAMFSSFQEISNSMIGFNKIATNLEQKVEITKQETSSSLVVTIVIFSIMLILTLFIKSR